MSAQKLFEKVKMKQALVTKSDTRKLMSQSWLFGFALLRPQKTCTVNSTRKRKKLRPEKAKDAKFRALKVANIFHQNIKQTSQFL